MKYQSAQHGHGQVLGVIAKAVEDAKTALNIQMSPRQIEMLVDDLYDVYQNESIEEVITCLKKGRQGKFGFGHNNRSSLTMLLIRDWMTEELKVKAAARETAHNQLKAESKEVLPDLDYSKFDFEAYRAKNKKKSTEPVMNPMFEARKAKEAKKPVQKNRDVVINPMKPNHILENPQKIVEKIRDKVFQEVELTEDEEKFLKYHKIIIKNKELLQTFPERK